MLGAALFGEVTDDYALVVGYWQKEGRRNGEEVLKLAKKDWGK